MTARARARGRWSAAAVLGLAAAGLLALVLSGCGSGGTVSGATTRPAAPVTDPAGREAAPQFSAVTLDGLKVDNDTFKGMPLVLAFWGSW